ncbi:MAG: glycerol-3-phosphate acyltransferase [Anaerolineae bacterium]
MPILVIILGYLLGSISSAYLAGRWLKGIDLRRYGSGTVSGTGVYQHVARGAMVAVGIFDVAKGAFPTWLGIRLGLGLPLALAAGLAAVAGHNWPFYLGFKGGRGLATMLGILLVVLPWGALWLLVTLGLGRLLRYTALGALVGVAALPFLSWITEQPPAVAWACGGMLFLTVAKRLEANRLPLPPPGAKRRQTLMRRFLFDRDVGTREPWTERGPVD